MQPGYGKQKAHPAKSGWAFIIHGMYVVIIAVSLTYLFLRAHRNGIGTFNRLRMSVGLPRLQRASTLRLSG